MEKVNVLKSYDGHKAEFEFEIFTCDFHVSQKPCVCLKKSGPVGLRRQLKELLGSYEQEGVYIPYLAF